MSIPAVGVSNIMLRLAAYRLFLFVFPLIVAIFVFAKTSTSEVEYTAYARLLPPQANNTTATSLASQIGGNAVLGASALTLKNPSDLYASIFLSRFVQDYVIREYQLAKYYGEPDIDSLRHLVSRKTKVEVGRDGIITLAYTDQSSEKSAQIANGMIAAMYRLAKDLSRNEASRRSEFYDTLIEEAVKKREIVSKRLVEAEKASGLTRLKGQEEASAAVVIELKGLIATREVELQKLSVVATQYHPEIIRIQSELSALRNQLEKISENRVMSNAKGSVPITAQSSHDKESNLASSVGKFVLPFDSYAELRSQVEPLRREEDVANQVVEQLVKAKALSKVDESRDLAVISVLDPATAPTKKSGPRVMMSTISATIISFLMAFVLALAWDVLLARDARRSRWADVFWAFFGRGRSFSFAKKNAKNTQENKDTP